MARGNFESNKHQINRGVGLGIGDFIKDLIMDGLNNQEILKRVTKKFRGKCATTINNVAWYRNDMRMRGVRGIKTNREVIRDQQKA